MARFYATFPSLSIHFAGCYHYMTNQDFLNIRSYHKITAEVFEFSFILKNYLRISVSIGTSAKCRSYTVMLFKADTLLFKTIVIYSLDMLSSLILCCFAFQNCLLGCAETKRQTCIQEN